MPKPWRPTKTAGSLKLHLNEAPVAGQVFYNKLKLEICAAFDISEESSAKVKTLLSLEVWNAFTWDLEKLGFSKQWTTLHKRQGLAQFYLFY